IARLLAFENFSGIDPDQTIIFCITASIAHQTASGGELAILVDGRNLMADGASCLLLAVKNVSGLITSAPTCCLRKFAKTVSKSRSVLAYRTRSVSPRALAAAWKSRDKGSAIAGMVGLTRSPTLVAVGTTACSNSSRFGPISV